MNRLSAWFSELAPRERRLLSLFGAVTALLVCILIPIGVNNASLQSRRDANAELRDTVMRLQAGKAAVKARQVKRDQIAGKYAKRAPKLGGFLEQIAKDNKIEIPEQQDKPEVPIGKRYVERSTQLRLRKVPGLPLLRFLEKIESSGYPLAISRLNVRKRGGDHDSYDIELVVSAYDRNDAPAAAPAPTSSGGDGK
jgi:general secretion pathway protein M